MFVLFCTVLFTSCERIENITSPVVSNEATIVEFPDKILAERVREELNLPIAAAITKSKLSELTSLQILLPQDATEDEKITDITGLEHATQLRTLRLRNHRISDIKLLPELKQVTYLDLDQNDIGDIRPISEMTHIRYLYLRENGINDISLLSNLTQLFDLALNNNAISDINPIAGMTQIRNLYLSYNAFL